jgi:hypothetical protein
LNVSDALDSQRYCIRILNQSSVRLPLLECRFEFFELVVIELTQPPIQLAKDFEQHDAWAFADHPLSDNKQILPAIPLVPFCR